ncbi:K2CO protein, partial [Tichodroma muraria]|nr:K2CO protein [Tichodroma muraria]
GHSPRAGAGLGCGPGGIRVVVVHQRPLVPLNLETGPNTQQVRQEEKDQVKSLSNRFASFINKARHFLQQQHRILETEWSLLEDQKIVQNNPGPTLEFYTSNTGQQLEALGGERLQLKALQDVVEDWVCFRYKGFTQGPREGLLPPPLSPFQDAAYVNKVDLGTRLDALTGEMKFLQTLYEAVRASVLDHISDTSVALSLDSSRDQDLDSIIAKVEAQDEQISNRSRAEAGSWYREK